MGDKQGTQSHEPFYVAWLVCVTIQMRQSGHTGLGIPIGSEVKLDSVDCCQ